MFRLVFQTLVQVKVNHFWPFMRGNLHNTPAQEVSHRFLSQRTINAKRFSMYMMTSLGGTSCNHRPGVAAADGERISIFPLHYDDVIMTMLASQITSLTVVYSIVYSGVNQRKHQSSASLAFVRDRWVSRTNGQLRGKCFHLMTSSWVCSNKACHVSFSAPDI